MLSIHTSIDHFQAPCFRAHEESLYIDVGVSRIHVALVEKSLLLCVMCVCRVRVVRWRRYTW
jgi:hypothetical protein